MKPLFTQEEYDTAKSQDKLKCECYQCGEIFYKQKSEINKVLNGTHLSYCKFCNNSCKHRYHGKVKYRVGQLSGQNCLHCNNPALYFSIETTGKFCSILCSRKYSSNISRKKKNNSLEQIALEKSKTYIYKKHYCERCDKYIGSDAYKKQFKYNFCDDCDESRKPYQTLLERLKCFDKNVSYEINVANALQVLDLEYNINKLSTIKINAKYNIVHPDVLRFMREYNCKIRNLSEASFLHISKHGISQKWNKNCFACGYHISWEGLKFWYRSSYELILAKKLDELKVSYIYENFRIPYQLENKNKIYIPDFYIPEYNLILEAKSDYFYKMHKEKCDKQLNATKEIGISGYFLFNDHIKQLKICNSFTDILELLQIKNAADN